MAKGKKKRKDKDYQIIAGHDGGTKELRKKVRDIGGMHIGHTPENTALTKSLIQDSLDFYASREWIEEREYLAGREFHKLWYYGGIKSRFAQSRMGAPPSGEVDSDSCEVMRQKYEKAKKAITGLLPALLCFNVCCLSYLLVDIKHFVDLQPDSPIAKNRRMLLLREGLSQLADHFKYKNSGDNSHRKSHA